MATAFALLGPTASGKSALALQMAQRHAVEIVSVDSAQVYRGMDIGTAKPSPEERSRVPHHLIDLIEPDQRYSTGRFRAEAIQATLDILRRGKVPLLVGGTMLYFRSLVSGLDALPGADAGLRDDISREAAARGWPAMHRVLAEVDPAAAQRIMPNDAQRIQRALEVFRLTGTPISALRTGKTETLPFELVMCGVMPERALLHERIERRFDAMLEAGLVDEVRSLCERYNLGADAPSMRAVGYRQVWSFLQGVFSEQQMRAQAISATRQLAKRQMTWLRSFGGLLRLDTGGTQDAAVALHLLLHERR